jgi:hypothetical protein
MGVDQTAEWLWISRNPPPPIRSSFDTEGAEAIKTGADLPRPQSDFTHLILPVGALAKLGGVLVVSPANRVPIRPHATNF